MHAQSPAKVLGFGRHDGAVEVHARASGADVQHHAIGSVDVLQLREPQALAFHLDRFAVPRATTVEPQCLMVIAGGGQALQLQLEVGALLRVAKADAAVFDYDVADARSGRVAAKMPIVLTVRIALQQHVGVGQLCLDGLAS